MPGEQRKILVTGASGFVGAHAVCTLAKQGHHVVAVGGTRPCPDVVEEFAAKTISLDLTLESETRELLNEVAPEVIVHCAAMARLEECEVEPKAAESANVTATGNLLSNASSTETFFCYISTDLVFDGGQAPEGGFDEQAEVNPKSVYAKTKQGGEALVQERAKRSLIARVCLVYGPAIGDYRGFLGWLQSSLEAGEQVPLFVDEWRTPIHTEDIVLAIDRVVGRRFSDKECCEVLHLAGPDRMSRYEFGEVLCEVAGYDLSLLKRTRQADLQMKAHRSPDVSLSSKKLQSDYGFSPRGVRAGLRDMIEG